MNTFITVVSSDFKLDEMRSGSICHILERLFSHDACPVRITVLLNGYAAGDKRLVRASIHVNLRAADFYVSSENEDVDEAVRVAIEHADRILSEFVEHRAAAGSTAIA